MQIFIGGFCFGLLLHTLCAADLDGAFDKHPVTGIVVLFGISCVWGGLVWGLFG